MTRVGRPRWWRWVGMLVALIALLTAAASATATAAAVPTVSLNPVGPAGAKGYYIYRARPGSRINGHVAVINTSSTRGTVLLYAVDATTGQTTGAVYLGRAQRRHDVGAWTKLPLGRVVLGSHGRTQVAFSVRVPRTARGGQHLGAIVAQPLTPVRRYAGKRGFHINVQALTVLAVQVNVPARPVQRLTVSGCHAGGPHGYQTLYIGMGNVGNQFVKGQGTLTVATTAGRTLKHQSFNVDTFLPGTSVSYPVVLTGRPLSAGHYRTVVSPSYGTGRRLTTRLGCTVSSHSLVQVFGVTNAAQITRPGGSGPSALAIVIGGVALLGLGFGAAVLLQRRAGHA